MRIIGRQVEGKADFREAFVQFSIKLYDKQNKNTHSHALTRNKQKTLLKSCSMAKQNIKLFANITQT